MKRIIPRFFPRMFSCLAALILLFCTSVLLARPGILKTNSGQVYNGDIRDNGDSYTVTVDKIDSQIAKTDVASVTYTGSIDEQFNQRIASLDPKDADGRVKAARFAFDNGRNDLALQALAGALQIDPENADALQMQRTVQAQQQLGQSHEPAGTPLAAGTPLGQTPGAPEATPSAPGSKHLLTPNDINTIRQYEIKPGEDIPIEISSDLRRKFAARAGMNYNDFSAMKSYDQLQLILQNGDADMKAFAKIGRDPETIIAFRRDIQPMVLRNCATSGCHGGPAGGNLILFNGNDQATTYTNFYIMEQFSMKTATSSGFFGGGNQRKLINRGDGAHSLLVAFGLPAGEADITHPKVHNSDFNGIFHGRDDRLCRRAIDWMDHGLNLIEPSYGINYTPPTGPTSQPATMP